MEKVDNIHEQMGNFSKEMETEKESRGNLEYKHVISKVRNSSTSLSTDLT